MPVHMQHPAASDLVRGNVGGIDGQTIRAMPEDGALPGGLVDDDIGALIGTAGADLNVIEIHAGLAEAGHLDAAAFVVADRSDVLGAQAEFSAGGKRAGDLATGTHDFALKSNLSTVLRVFRNQQQSIGSV